MFRFLGPLVVPFYPFLGEGSPTEMDYRKKGYPYSNLSNLEDLGLTTPRHAQPWRSPSLSRWQASSAHLRMRPLPRPHQGCREQEARIARKSSRIHFARGLKHIGGERSVETKTGALDLFLLLVRCTAAGPFSRETKQSLVKKVVDPACTRFRAPGRVEPWSSHSQTPSHGQSKSVPVVHPGHGSGAKRFGPAPVRPSVLGLTA